LPCQMHKGPSSPNTNPGAHNVINPYL